MSSITELSNQDLRSFETWLQEVFIQKDGHDNIPTTNRFPGGTTEDEGLRIESVLCQDPDLGNRPSINQGIFLSNQYIHTFISSFKYTDNETLTIDERNIFVYKGT